MKYRHLYHFAGVATIGVGDSLAAIIGSKYGRLYWPKSQKTMEGKMEQIVEINVELLFFSLQFKLLMRR
ncbi:unnamed protein product [Brugia timori]|uniref:dolichol kinase n=1 Tax=Brugia timori TaxID=42155 RepID=A0A0R3RA45_9BILA|nr:unnamed protein product [Brugia timori]